MRSRNINKDATGNGPESDLINRILLRLEELQFYDTDTIKWVQTPRGTRANAKITPAGGVASAPAGNWNYRGGYNPANTYNTFDVTLLGAGTAAGMYLSTIDGNNNSPDSGIGWVQVMTGTGVWL